MVRFWSLILPLLLAAAAPAHAQDNSKSLPNAETILALKGLQKLDQQMNAVGWKLVSANAPFCRKKSANAGLLLHDIMQYGDRGAARLALGFAGEIALNVVAAGSPGDIAGLKPGDSLIAINQLPAEEIVIDGSIAATQKPEYRRIAALNIQLDAALASGRTIISVVRGGLPQDIAITPQQTCASKFQIRVSKKRAASADGERVSLSSALAEYFADEDEWAAVVAHELAHNLLNHRDRLSAKKVNRGFFGQFGKSAGRIKAAEIEADRLSIWLMANAGYDPRAATRFWTRYGKQHGRGIFSASTHYRWKKRVKLFEEEIAKMAMVKLIDGKRLPPLLAGANDP